MLFDFFKKYRSKNGKKFLIINMINGVNIPEKNKFLYLEALKVLKDEELDNLYNDLINFIKNYELNELDKINEENFSLLKGMKKKEAIEKQKEINAFSFLINNV